MTPQWIPVVWWIPYQIWFWRLRRKHDKEVFTPGCAGWVSVWDWYFGYGELVAEIAISGHKWHLECVRRWGPHAGMGRGAARGVGA